MRTGIFFSLFTGSRMLVLEDDWVLSEVLSNNHTALKSQSSFDNASNLCDIVLGHILFPKDNKILVSGLIFIPVFSFYTIN